MKRLLRWIFTGEWEAPKAGEFRCPVTQKVIPVGWRYCEMCDSHIAPERRCDYGWDGNCSAAGFSWTRDNPPAVRSGKA